MPVTPPENVRLVANIPPENVAASPQVAAIADATDAATALTRVNLILAAMRTHKHVAT